MLRYDLQASARVGRSCNDESNSYQSTIHPHQTQTCASTSHALRLGNARAPPASATTPQGCAARRHPGQTAHSAASAPARPARAQVGRHRSGPRCCRFDHSCDYQAASCQSNTCRYQTQTCVLASPARSPGSVSAPQASVTPPRGCAARRHQSWTAHSAAMDPARPECAQVRAGMCRVVAWSIRGPHPNPATTTHCGDGQSNTNNHYQTQTCVLASPALPPRNARAPPACATPPQGCASRHSSQMARPAALAPARAASAQVGAVFVPRC